MRSVIFDALSNVEPHSGTTSAEIAKIDHLLFGTAQNRTVPSLKRRFKLGQWPRCSCLISSSALMLSKARTWSLAHLTRTVFCDSILKNNRSLQLSTVVTKCREAWPIRSVHRCRRRPQRSWTLRIIQLRPRTWRHGRSPTLKLRICVCYTSS